MVHSLPHAMAVLDRDGTILAANPHLERLVARPVAELVGGGAEVLLAAPSRELLHAARRSLSAAVPGPQGGEGSAGSPAAAATQEVTEGADTRLDLQACRGDGSLFAAEVCLSRIVGSSAVAMTVRDTSAQVGIDDRFRRFFQQGPDAVLACDESGRIVESNAQADRIFGYPPGQLRGHLVDELVPDPCCAVHPHRRATFLAAPALRPMGSGEELCGRRRDGSQFPIEINLSPIEGSGADGGLLVLSTVRDVGERHRDADEARLRMASLVDSARLGIVSATPDGRIASWNGGAQALLGNTAEEMIGRSLTGLLADSTAEEDADLLIRLESGELVESFDITRHHRSGRVVTLSVTVSPIIARNGETIGRSAVFQDITERTQAEADLARAKDLAETTSREFEAFSYAVAHDLRAPLRAVDGFSQALVEDYPQALDEVGRGYLEQMRSSAQYMGRLIESLLSLSRLTHGGIQIARVDMSALAQASVARLRTAEPDRQVEVQIADGIFASGDAAMLGIVMDNLIGNAWKYTRGCTGPRIEFRSSVVDGVTTYVIQDNGVGFDMTYSDKLFGVFQRLHPVESFEGTGIGLATVRKIIQRHEGKVWAFGDVGRGATFSFTLEPDKHPRPPLPR